MKKQLLLFLFVLSSFFGKAQVIQGFRLSPINPNTNDFIYMFVDMSFPSGGCGDHQQSLSLAGTAIYGSALHCLGPLSFICNYTDTFDIGNLNAGNYSFKFNVNVGGGPSPCSPGIVPGPNDSISFSVSQAASIQELSDKNISISYNALQSKISLHFTTALSKGKVSIYNLTGQVLKAASITSNTQSLSVAELSEGLYVVEIASDKGRFSKRIFIQH